MYAIIVKLFNWMPETPQRYKPGEPLDGTFQVYLLQLPPLHGLLSPGLQARILDWPVIVTKVGARLTGQVSMRSMLASLTNKLAG